jgi:Prokaryotic N-terminal methylation motif
MKNNQKGFSIFEILIVIVILFLIGAVSWLVYDRQKSKSSANKVSTKIDVSDQKNEGPKSSSTIDPTAKWLKYTSQNKKYSISIPDGWSLNSLMKSDGIYAWDATSIKYSEGNIASVKVVEGGRDGSSIGFMMWLNNDGNIGSFMSPELTKVNTYVTPNAINVNKYTRTQKNEPEGMDIPKGTLEYKYELIKDGSKIYIIHDILPGEKDQSQLIEQMIQTTKFL